MVVVVDKMINMIKKGERRNEKKKIINKEKVTKTVLFILVTHIIYLKLHNKR